MGELDMHGLVYMYLIIAALQRNSENAVFCRRKGKLHLKSKMHAWFSSAP